MIRAEEIARELLPAIPVCWDEEDEPLCIQRVAAALESYAKEEREQLATCRAALNSLTNEAAGFLDMADTGTHGYTNIRCLHDRILEARLVLARIREGREGK